VTKRVVIALVGIVVGLNLAFRAVELAYPSPSGPPASAYATSEDGLAAFAELLRRDGHAVARLRERPRELELDPARTTLVLADAGIVEEEDAKALRRFVERGGRLLAAGPAYGWLADLVEPAPVWDSGAPWQQVRVLAPRQELTGIHRIVGATGSWEKAGATLPLLGGDEGGLVNVARIGRGEAFLLADTGPLRNETLAFGDNAALALALGGAPERRVAFLERYHGYGAESGLRAIPNGWLVTLGGMLAAALAFMLARGRRLGPVEAATRELAPPRRLYAEALGVLLARTRRPALAVAPLRARALETADRLGVSAEERSALETADPLGLGKRAAGLERRARRLR
jgi:hypothetical protein